MQTTAQSHFCSSLVFSGRLTVPGCRSQLIPCEKGGPSYIMLSKYEDDILINGFSANFQISIAKWSMKRHVADNGF